VSELLSKAPNLQPAGNQERNDQFGNQHYSREHSKARKILSLHEAQ